jgi:2-polyprenyl-6-methoxyphenol hydroxylase-like FAD-dependent oxidoreductase
MPAESRAVEPNERYDVIVVGGGPIGATLTGDLGRRGIRVLLLEQGDGSIVDARMHHVNIRSMEILRTLGLEDELRTCGWPADHPQDVVFVTKLDGEEIARIPWGSINEMRAPQCSPTYAQRCPQAWFNPIVTAFARRQEAAEVRHFCRAETIKEDSGGVTVEATDVTTGERRTFRALYLVGCDGPRSQVRDLINADRELPNAIGRSAEIIFRSRNLQKVSRFGRVGRYIFVGEDGLGATLMAFDGVDRYRLVLMIQPERLTPEDMREHIRKIADAQIDVEFLTPVLSWVNRIVSAPHYSSERIVLAGDSAHGMPPTGGFGMNTGFVDLFDLGWRLEALVKGWGGPLLLRAYESERRQAVARISNMAAEIYKDWIDWSVRMRAMGEALNASGPEAVNLRRQTGRELANTLYREFNSLGGPLGYRYESAICIPDGTPEPSDGILDYVQTARPGHRAPHAWLSNNVSTLDRFGKCFVLLAFAPSPALVTFRHEADRQGIALDIVSVEDEKIAALYERAFVLVRPDGIVAWRSDTAPDDAGAILATVTGHIAASAAERGAGKMAP